MKSVSGSGPCCRGVSGVCGRSEVHNDLDVGSHNEKCQREWTMLPRCVFVCVCGRGEV